MFGYVALIAWERALDLVAVLYLCGVGIWCLTQACQGAIREQRNQQRTRIVGRRTW